MGYWFLIKGFCTSIGCTLRDHHHLRENLIKAPLHVFIEITCIALTYILWRVFYFDRAMGGKIQQSHLCANYSYIFCWSWTALVCFVLIFGPLLFVAIDTKFPQHQHQQLSFFFSSVRLRRISNFEHIFYSVFQIPPSSISFVSKSQKNCSTSKPSSHLSRLQPKTDPTRSRLRSDHIQTKTISKYCL